MMRNKCLHNQDAPYISGFLALRMFRIIYVGNLLGSWQLKTTILYLNNSTPEKFVHICLILQSDTIAMKLETACECECRFRYRRGHGYLVPFLLPSRRLKNIKSCWYEACGFIWFHDCHESTIWCKNRVVLWIEYLTYPQKTWGVNGFLSIYRFTKVYKGLNLYIERKPFT